MSDTDLFSHMGYRHEDEGKNLSLSEESEILKYLA